MSTIRFEFFPFKASLVVLFCFITIFTDATPLVRIARQTIPGASASITGTSLNYGSEGQYPINTNYGYQTQQQIPYHDTQVPSYGGVGSSWRNEGSYSGVGGYGQGGYGYGGYGMGGHGMGGYGAEGYGMGAYGGSDLGKTGWGAGSGSQGWKGFGAGKNPYGAARYPQQGVKY